MGDSKKGHGLRFNTGKPNYNFIPRVGIEVEALVWELGHAKYGYNWETGQAWSIPLACLRRHAAALAEGEWLDPESGLPHIGHIKANCTMLAYFYYHDLGENDIIRRAPQVRDLPNIVEKVKEFEDKYKGKKLNLSPPLMETEVTDREWVHKILTFDKKSPLEEKIGNIPSIEGPCCGKCKGDK